MAKSLVAVLKVKPQRILEDVARLCELGGMPQALASGKLTFLQEGLASSRPFPSSNTTPWQLEGAILALARHGWREVACARTDRAAARNGADPNGLWPIVERYAVRTVDDLEPEDKRWVEYRPRARLHVLHQLFPEGILLPKYLFGANVVHLPTVKCSARTTTTGAMSCAQDSLLGARRHHALGEIQRALVDLLAIQKEIHGGIFAVMDGTTAGNGPGPRALVPVVKDYMLASADQVAIDAVAAKMMGFDPMQLEFIRLAHDDGLGVGDPAEIEIVGEDISGQSWGFDPGDSVLGRFESALRLGSLEPVHRFFFQTPLVNLLSAGSDAYRDHYRWPRREKNVFELWRAQTHWGHLFTRYREGPIGHLTQPPA